MEGELGVGKTTFAQGLARGLGVKDSVTSPTYALEQRYDDLLVHVDLYRLGPEAAERFLSEMEERPGVTIIEWASRRARAATSHDIDVRIEDTEGIREISIECRDIRIPSDAEIERWYHETKIQKHVIAHMRCVSEQAEKTALSLLRQGRFIRKSALRAAALCHDILRYVDFKAFAGSEVFPDASNEERAVWKAHKDTYGVPHEFAAERFLTSKGYPEIGRMIRTHRGAGTDDEAKPETIEQMALMYADKRALQDTPVSVDERFDDFLMRYAGGKETAITKARRQGVKDIEAFLFPEGTTF